MGLLTIGVISDTHGLLRPEAVEALRGSDAILHAGDIGAPSILKELAALAPVMAVRGNNDRNAWAAGIPETVELAFGKNKLFMIHDLKQLPIDPARSGVKIVVSGHSHQPLIRRNGGVLYLNPGAAGPRRFHLPITVAQLMLSGVRVEAAIVPLKV